MCSGGGVTLCCVTEEGTATECVLPPDLVFLQVPWTVDAENSCPQQCLCAGFTEQILNDSDAGIPSQD